MTKHDFLHVMHELTRVLQNGLNLHQRAPGASDVHARYVANQCRLESKTRRAKDNSLPVYVKSTWHLSLPNVGILMVARRRCKHATAGFALLKIQARQAAHGKRIRCQLLRCAWNRHSNTPLLPLSFEFPVMCWDGTAQLAYINFENMASAIDVCMRMENKNCAYVRTIFLICRAMPDTMRATCLPIVGDASSCA